MGLKTSSSTVGINNPINKVSASADTYFCAPINGIVETEVCGDFSGHNHEPCFPHERVDTDISCEMSINRSKNFCPHVRVGKSSCVKKSLFTYLRKIPFFVANGFKKSLLFLIRFYQKYISGATSPKCRYLPTCSDYAHEALIVHGLLKGMGLTFLRLLRCHPWVASRVDFVPDQKATLEITGKTLLFDLDEKGCTPIPMRPSIKRVFREEFQDGKRFSFFFDDKNHER